jgi:hypothetical protein
MLVYRWPGVLQKGNLLWQFIVATDSSLVAMATRGFHAARMDRVEDASHMLTRGYVAKGQ